MGVHTNSFDYERSSEWITSQTIQRVENVNEMGLLILNVDDCIDFIFCLNLKG